MRARDVPTHYLRPNHAERTPRAVIFWDTETRVVQDGDPQVLGLRCWVARRVLRAAKTEHARNDTTSNGHTAQQLCDTVETFMIGQRSVMSFAHNLAFDLSTTRLPLLLAGRGWTITDASIGGRSPWVRLAKGNKRLTLADSSSWLPYPLAEIAARLGMVKPALPGHDDQPAAWLERCTADVDILATAMLELMAWWDRGQLGNWTLTGPACGWNAMRHHYQPGKILINTEADGIRADRETIHGGRRTVWRVGTLSNGPYVELDFEAAYPTIAAVEQLPAGRQFAVHELPLDSRYLTGGRWQYAGRVRVRTPVPRWPVRIDGATFYPVGEFWTDLAAPDVTEALRLGALVQVGAGHVHQMGLSMRYWARWILDTQAGAAPDSPPVAQLIAKTWGRSVLGKWAAHGFERIDWGVAPNPGWSYEEGWDHESQTRGGIVDMAGRRYWVGAGTEPDNAYPAILASIEAHIRLRLARVIEAIGPGALVQADTDGLIVAERMVGTKAARGHLRAPEGMSGPARVTWVLDQLDPVTAPLRLRVKRSVDHVQVLGPQHLKVGAQRRLAGVPGASLCPDCADADARRAGRGQPVRCEHMPVGEPLVSHLWPKLAWQMRHGDPQGYTRPLRTVHLGGPKITGWVTTGNRVIPPSVAVTAAGLTRLLPWSLTALRGEHDRLVPVQHPLLDALR